MTDALVLAQWEQTERTRNILATGSASPLTYSPLTSDSPTVTFVGHDAQYGRGRRWGFSIRGVILHTTEGDSFASSMRYNARRAETVSASFHVGQAGEIGQGVPEADRPWTTGRWNDETISIEINGRAADTAAEWLSRPNQLDALTDLLVDLCSRHLIPCDWLSPDEWAEGASRQSVQPYRMGGRRGLIDHDGANKAAIKLGGSPAQYGHHDIGDGLRSVVLLQVLPEVERRLISPPTPPPPTPEDDSMLIAFRIGTPKDPEPIYEQTGGLATWVTPDRWADLSNAPVNVVSRDYTRQLILLGPPHPDFIDQAAYFRDHIV